MTSHGTQREGPRFGALSQLFSVANIILLALYATTTCGQTSNQLVKVEYDSGKDITQVNLNPIVLASRKFEELRLGAVAGYPGKVKSKPSEIVLILMSLSHTDENRYESARKLSVVADERKFDFGETQRAKQAQNDLFIEMMIAKVSMNDFLFVSKAKQVKLKLGLTEVELSSSQINALKLFASYLTE
jgi:hypothetical protein